MRYRRRHVGRGEEEGAGVVMKQALKFHVWLTLESERGFTEEEVRESVEEHLVRAFEPFSTTTVLLGPIKEQLRVRPLTTEPEPR